VLRFFADAQGLCLSNGAPRITAGPQTLLSPLSNNCEMYYVTTSSF